MEENIFKITPNMLDLPLESPCFHKQHAFNFASEEEEYPDGGTGSGMSQEKKNEYQALSPSKTK